jgi:two-component sensor histidine kinase/DNA-binding response OmpR family regulator
MVGDPHEKVSILLVDDHPAKLMAYEVILQELGENLLKAASGKEALEQLLKHEVAVVLVDVCMPDLDGFQLAQMIREHPRFQNTAMIFISAIHLSDVDRLRGYAMGAVDYVPVPVIPEVLRAKVKVFAELYRKTRQLERLNAELESRVGARTSELEASSARLIDSEQRRTLALMAGSMGSWEWDGASGKLAWDDGQYRICGLDPKTFTVTPESAKALVHPDDYERLWTASTSVLRNGKPFQSEFRVRRPNGEIRWCVGTAFATIDDAGRTSRITGVTVDITERKQAEERQLLLAQEVDHRAKNALTLVQSILRLTRATEIDEYVEAVEGRIRALSRAHTILSHSRWQGADLGGLIEEEFAPYTSAESGQVVVKGPKAFLDPNTAQALALALHELAANAAKYGALSSEGGRIELSWSIEQDRLILNWIEQGGPRVRRPAASGFGTKIIMGSVERQLHGAVTFEWRPEGLRCVLSVPRPKVQNGSSGLDPVTPRAAKKAAPAANSGARRIMIVEDEVLIAMVLVDHLRELGLATVGPFSRVADALKVEGEVDAAILDVNLGGESVYPVADMLRARRIPFVFMTGYGSASIDPRFAAVPVLQKPIDAKTLEDAFVNGDAPLQLLGDGNSQPAHRQAV